MTQAGRPRICIAHQTVWAGDAIGNDVVGGYELLTRCGYEVTILCRFVHPEVKARCRVVELAEPPLAVEEFDLLWYHHSIHWPAGEALIRSFNGPVVVKYHNITPPEYFEPYAQIYVAMCREGRDQTGRLATFPNVARWQADSAYNADELLGLGVSADKCSVVPPFNRVGRLLPESHAAVYPLEGPFVALFVGRRAPNKGHAHIVRTLAAWRDLFPESELRCRIIGATDPHLAPYYRGLEELEASLGVQGRIEWLEHVSNADLETAFRSSHVYLNMSEHEGFCVPLIEAQAVGLPVVSTGATALAETAGERQAVVPVPRDPVDYDVIAGLVHEICVSPTERRGLVEAGFANVFRRFTSQTIEARFLESLIPALQAVET
jgi:glycosyltransferase involved in cell wall biosynthesis